MWASRRIELQAADGSPVAALEDAGWRLGHQVDRLVLRRGDLSLQVDRVDNVYWLFDLIRGGRDDTGGRQGLASLSVQALTRW